MCLFPQVSPLEFSRQQVISTFHLLPPTTSSPFCFSLHDKQSSLLLSIKSGYLLWLSSTLYLPFGAQIVNILGYMFFVATTQLCPCRVKGWRFLNEWIWLFQLNFIDKNRTWAVFCLQVIVCWPLLHFIVVWTNPSQQSQSWLIEEFLYQPLRRYFFHLSIPIIKLKLKKLIFIKFKTIWCLNQCQGNWAASLEASMRRLHHPCLQIWEY